MPQAVSQEKTVPMKLEESIKEILVLLEERRKAVIILWRLEANDGQFATPVVLFRSRNHSSGNEQFISATAFCPKEVCDMVLDMAVRKQRHKVEEMDEKIAAMAKAAGIEVEA